MAPPPLSSSISIEDDEDPHSQPPAPAPAARRPPPSLSPPTSSSSTSSRSSRSHRSASPPPPPPPLPPPLPLASSLSDPSQIPPPSSSSSSPIATAIPLSPPPLHPPSFLPPHLHPSQRLFSLHLSSSSTPPPPSKPSSSSAPPPLSTPPSDRHSRDDFRHSRDDCWSEGATLTLIQAWGDRYVELNRGNLKQKHWKDVADCVNRRSNGSKSLKTDVQCKNRLDTLKKKYKLEKSKIVTGGGPSKWLFFDRLDELIGPSKKPKKASSPMKPDLSPPRHAPPSPLLVASVPPLKRPLPPSPFDEAAQEMKQTTQASPIQIIPVSSTPNPAQLPRQSAPISLNQQHFPPQAQISAPSPSIQPPQPPIAVLHPSHAPPPPSNHVAGVASDSDTSSKSKDNVDNLSADSSHNSGADAASPRGRGLKRKRPCSNNSTKLLANAIVKFSEVYERIEISKHQQMMELEKQRMEFTKDLELQRLKLLTQMQVELAKLKYSNKQCDTEHYL